MKNEENKLSEKNNLVHIPIIRYNKEILNKNLKSKENDVNDEINIVERKRKRLLEASRSDVQKLIIKLNKSISSKGFNFSKLNNNENIDNIISKIHDLNKSIKNLSNSQTFIKNSMDFKKHKHIIRLKKLIILDEKKKNAPNTDFINEHQNNLEPYKNLLIDENNVHSLSSRNIFKEKLFKQKNKNSLLTLINNNKNIINNPLENKNDKIKEFKRNKSFTIFLPSIKPRKVIIDYFLAYNKKILRKTPNGHIPDVLGHSSLYMGESYNPHNYDIKPKNRIKRNDFGTLFCH